MNRCPYYVRLLALLLLLTFRLPDGQAGPGGPGAGPGMAADADTLKGGAAAGGTGALRGMAADGDTLKSGSAAARRPGKNPTGAMLRSLALPGWGQWYNGKRFKAVVVAGVEVGLVVDAIVQNQLAAASEDFYSREFYRNNRSLAIWWLGAAILYSMADAYVDAHLFDFDDSLDLTLGPDLAPSDLPASPAMTFRLTLRL